MPWLWTALACGGDGTGADSGSAPACGVGIHPVVVSENPLLTLQRDFAISVAGEAPAWVLCEGEGVDGERLGRAP